MLVALEKVSELSCLPMLSFFFDQSSSPFRRCTEGKVSPRIAKGSTVVGRGVVDTKCEGRRRLHTLGLAGPRRRGWEREEEIERMEDRRMEDGGPRKDGGRMDDKKNRGKTNECPRENE